MAVWNVYVGTFTSEFPWLTGPAGKGIDRFSFDDASGSLRYLETTIGVLSPQYLAPHRRLPVLYAAEFAVPGRLTRFAIGPKGSLERASTTPSLGEMAVAVSIHPSARHAYVANWGSGTLAALVLDPDGMVMRADPIAQLKRRESLDKSKRASHPHHIRPSPSGNSVLVAYAGLDELTAYRADAAGALSHVPIVRIEFPPESAPRHIEFHPSGQFVYVVGERDSRLYVLESEDGLPTRIRDSYATPPTGYSDRNNPSEIKLHMNGRTLYVGNRGSDCVTIFRLDPSGGFIEAAHHQPSLGRGPRAISIDPTGQYLLVGNADSGDLAVFQIDDKGGLRSVGPPVRSPSPSSIAFAPSTVTPIKSP
jgi:6-phosphogluconolactonase